MNQLKELSLGRNLLIALVGLLSGLLFAFGGLWVASRAGLMIDVDGRVLFAIAAVCVLLAAFPWSQKKPTPEGLAK